MMKAVVHNTRGAVDGLALEDIDIPAVAHEEVLLRVHAASVDVRRCLVVTGVPKVWCSSGYGPLRPSGRVPGADVSGTVVDVGAGVNQFQPGDEVFGWCEGAAAEYARARQYRLVTKPDELTFEQAACVGLGAVTALRGVRDVAGVRRGRRVLVTEASGDVGMFAVQIAKALGAEVSAICDSDDLDLVRSFGADDVIDRSADATDGGARYDVVIDLDGCGPVSAFRRLLTPRGRYVLVLDPTDGWYGPLARLGVSLASALARRRLDAYTSMNARKSLIALQELIADGKITPVIDRAYPITEALAAIDHAAAGHARGKVILTMETGAG